MEVVIRAAEIDDIEAMYGITSRVHLSDFYIKAVPQRRHADYTAHYQQSPQSLNVFRKLYLKRLKSPLWHCFVACSHDKVIGYTLAMSSEGYYELRGLFVDPQHQSKGVGSQLFVASLKPVQKRTPIYLKVLQINNRAKRLYEKNGFRIIKPAESTFYDLVLEVMERR